MDGGRKTPPQGSELTRLFRMTPQDEAPMFPPFEEQPTLPRMEPVTQFFSADELRSRGEKVNPHGFGSGEFATVRQRKTLLIGTASGATSTPPTTLDANRAEPQRRDRAGAAPLRLGFEAPRGARSRRGTSCSRSSPSPFRWCSSKARRSAPRYATSATNATNATSATAPIPSATTPASTTAVAAGAVTARSPVATAATSQHGPTAERAAIDAVAEGRYAAALDLYRKLATEDPSRQSYRDAARILAARLTAPP